MAELTKLHISWCGILYHIQIWGFPASETGMSFQTHRTPLQEVSAQEGREDCEAVHTSTMQLDLAQQAWPHYTLIMRDNRSCLHHATNRRELCLNLPPWLRRLANRADGPSHGRWCSSVAS